MLVEGAAAGGGPASAQPATAAEAAHVAAFEAAAPTTATNAADNATNGNMDAPTSSGQPSKYCLHPMVMLQDGMPDGAHSRMQP